MLLGSPGGTSGKEPACRCRRHESWGFVIFDKGGKNIQWIKDHLFNKWCWEIWSTTCKRMKLEHFLWRRQWHPTPVLLPGKSHGRRSLVGCSPWVAKSRTQLSDFTFTFHFHALEKEMSTHSSVLAWRIPGTGEPGGLPSIGLHRVRHD